MTNNSIYRNFFVRQEFNIDDNGFKKRVKNLEDYLLSRYNVEVVGNGWRCLPKDQLNPGFVVTKESLPFILKNLGF